MRGMVGAGINVLTRYLMDDDAEQVRAARVPPLYLQAEGGVA